MGRKKKMAQSRRVGSDKAQSWEWKEKENDLFLKDG